MDTHLLSGLRGLVVEDVALNAKLYADLIEAMGAAVVRAASMSGAVEAALANAVDFVVLDDFVGDESAARFIDRARAAGLSAPVILVLAHYARGDKDRDPDDPLIRARVVKPITVKSFIEGLTVALKPLGEERREG